ncbi:methyltransferase domain-containing protein [Phenylobacterium sp.]|uniref:class I SAM-dependent methyltransferase n=1 Tax=Phenylobacterium sp. TaxID=1871053 RepID=UPI0025CFEC44|nr:methyltransferase domain-containing protein [Phenylobacterium sp.]
MDAAVAIAAYAGRMSLLSQLPPGAFAKQDDGDDAEFYAQARLKTHIDDAAIAALTGFYRQVLPPGGVLLDLMSSWVSHLPPEVAYGEVMGHGMNAEELAANPRLTRWFLQDLNRAPTLALEDASIDAAMICVGVQYLQQPAAVLAEAARVLRPGALLVVSYSNRCFPTKAVAVWRDIGPQGHARLIELYLEAAGFAGIEVHRLMDGRASDPLTVVMGRAPAP